MPTLKIILRGWIRSALSSTISLLSLAIGLLCATILLLFAVTEFRMAKTLGNDPNVYFVEHLFVFQTDQEVYMSSISKELMVSITENYPEVREWTFLCKSEWGWQYDDIKSERTFYTISVPPSFTKFATIPIEEGCLDSILRHHNAIAITRTYANLIFPGENPIGKTIDAGWKIKTDDQFENKKRTFVVEGIIDDSSPSFLKIRAILPYSEEHVSSVHNHSFSVLIKLHEGISPDVFAEKINADSIYYAKIRLTKASDAYFEFSKQSPNSLFKTRDKSILVIGFSVALTILLISSFNYLNITLIRAPKRLKNLAGQRIMGASKAQVAGQILAETSLHVGTGFGIALIFMPSAMQLFNSFMKSDLQWQHLIQWNNLPCILTLLCTLILIPAIYLIFKFTIKNPMEVFKNPTGNKIQYLGSLVVLQIIISVVLIAFSINVKRQMDYIVNTVPQSDQILRIGGKLPQDFVDHLLQSNTTIDFIPSDISSGRVMSEDNKYYYEQVTSPNYFEFLNIPIVMGHTFDAIPTEIIQTVVNKSFIRYIELKDDPLGYEFTLCGKKFRIVGVCEDFSNRKATLSDPPVLYTFRSENDISSVILIRFQGLLDDKINEINELYEKYKEDETALTPWITTLTDYYINMNPEVKRLRIMVEFFAFISIFLSAMGLFGLSWYTVERRHKEIALRKIHGATTGKLLLLLCKTFFIWCAIATVIALPIGYFISQRWLSGFVYRIDNSLWTLVLTALIAAAVTFLTVIFQTTRAAMSNPAKYIKEV